MKIKGNFFFYQIKIFFTRQNQIHSEVNKGKFNSVFNMISSKILVIKLRSLNLLYANLLSKKHETYLKKNTAIFKLLIATQKEKRKSLSFYFEKWKMINFSIKKK